MIHSGVGGIVASDVNLAAASNAIVVGFNVRPNADAKALAEREGVDIRTYRVIYKLTEDIQQALIGMLSPEKVEEVMGEAEVRQTLKASKVGTIAGCMVTQGVLQRGAQVRICAPVRSSTTAASRRSSASQTMPAKWLRDSNVDSPSRTSTTSKRATCSRPTRSKKLRDRLIGGRADGHPDAVGDPLDQ